MPGPPDVCEPQRALIRQLISSWVIPIYIRDWKPFGTSAAYKYVSSHIYSLRATSLLCPIDRTFSVETMHFINRTNWKKRCNCRGDFLEMGIWVNTQLRWLRDVRGYASDLGMVDTGINITWLNHKWLKKKRMLVVSTQKWRWYQ